MQLTFWWSKNAWHANSGVDEKRIDVVKHASKTVTTNRQFIRKLPPHGFSLGHFHFNEFSWSTSLGYFQNEGTQTSDHCHKAWLSQSWTLCQKTRLTIHSGTSSIVDEKTHEPLLSVLTLIVETAVKLHKDGHKVIIVSSGAIGVGLRRMDLDKRPKHLPRVQVCVSG